MSTRKPELEIPDIDELDTPFKRRLALTVALIALLGGIVGYAASDASVRAAKTLRDAQRASVVALAEQDTATAQFEESFSNYIEVSTVQRRHDIEEVQAQLLGPTPLSSDAQTWAQAGQKLTDVSTLLQPGRYTDRPDLWWNKLFEAPDLATLQQQADQHTASAWGKKANLYLGVITSLAVALTLLSLSLTVGVGVRRFLLWPAVLIVACGLVGFLIVLIRPTTHTSEAAIAAVVEGDRLSADRDFDGALAAYNRAVDLDPSYPTAFQRRGTARLVAGSPEREKSLFVISTTSKEARQAGVADLNQALDLGGEDYPTLVNQGANYFHLADYTRSEELSRRALALNPTLPLPWLNLGLALVSQGRENDAADVYQHAIELIEQRPYLQERLELYASARGTLEKLLGLRPDLAASVRRFQGELVQAQGRAQLPNARSANGMSVSAMTAATSGSTLRITVDYSNLPSNSRLVWIVYYRSGPDQDWVQRSDLSLFEQTHLLPSGSAVKEIPDTNCLTAGEYRIDLYADAQQLASAVASPPATPLKLIPYTDPLATLSLCRPENWTLSANLTGTVELTSPDQRHQLSVRVVPLPTEVSAANRQMIVTETLNRLTNSFSPNARTTRRSAADRIGFVVGSARILMLPDTTGAFVWASVGTDNVLRTVTARYPAGDLYPLADLILRIELS